MRHLVMFALLMMACNETEEGKTRPLLLNHNAYRNFSASSIINEINLGLISLKDKLPPSYLLNGSIYTDDRILKQNIEVDSAKQEIEFSRFWMAKLVPSRYGSGLQDSRFRFVENIHRNDDGTFVAFRLSDQYVECIDARQILVLLSGENVRKDTIDKIIEKISLSYRWKIVEKNDINDSVSYGKFMMSPFTKPIEWYKEDETMILLAEKFLKVPRRGTRKTLLLIFDSCREKTFKKRNKFESRPLKMAKSVVPTKIGHGLT